MSALSRALQTYRPHEQDYIAELDSIRWEIEFLLDFITVISSHKSAYLAIEDLEKRETLIKKALRRPILPPFPDDLRNPFTRSRTPAQREHIRQLIKGRGKRTRYVPME